MKTSFESELRAAGLPRGPGPFEPVSARDLDQLPEPAQRYLRFMKVAGRPRDWSFRLAWKGRFRTGYCAPWTPCVAWQYNSSLEIARVFRMRLRLGGFLPAVGHDLYLGGHGRMRIRMLGRFPLVDAQGPEYDLGELVTWLDDAVFFAPSMLLGPETVWRPVDDSSFDLQFSDRDRTVTARVHVDDTGVLRDFETSDRFCQDPSDGRRLLRARWTTPIEKYETVGGRPVPVRARAIWHLPQGEFPYAEFHLVPGSLAFNVAPGD